MNHQHPNIKFTFEIIEKFSFLDVKICRESNKFTTSVFRKPTFSGVFTNFVSFMTISYKHGLANTLIFLCSKICSYYGKLHNEIVYLKEIFKRNRHPNGFVDINYQTVEKKQLLIILPFLGLLSFETRNRLIAV